MLPRYRILFSLTGVLFCSLIFASSSRAQADPPERVARLNLIEGTVSFLPSGGDVNDWVQAVPNRPLTTGDRLWSDAGSRCELHIGSTAIRLSDNTGMSFLNLDNTTVQIRLSEGSLIFRLRESLPDEIYEIDAPNLSFQIKRPGNYRIDFHPDANETTVTVRQGEGEAIGGGRSWQVISDQQAAFTGTDNLAYDLRDADAQPLNDFDQWARSRDERESRLVRREYVSPQMTGYEDLDGYGAWRQVPDYGWCWTPNGVPVAWAPYRYGHWVWIAPWGWTWVDDAPWGFAPFHYGRWAYYRSAWMWVPGPIVVRPVYAPALVAWVGGGGFSFSVGIGAGVGWFPLGPREVFVPTYRVSERYVTNINVTNTIVNRTTVVNVYNERNVQNISYVNRGAPNAVTVVSRDTFVNARPVGRSIVNVPARELTAAPVSRGALPAPERASVYGAGSRNAPHPRADVVNRPVVTREAPPPSPNHFAQVQSPPTTRTQAPPMAQRRSASPDRPPDRAATSRGGVAPATQPQSLSRPAPPVRTPTAREQADQQRKERAWSNAHPRSKQEDKPKRSPHER